MSGRNYIKVSYRERQCVECGEPFKPVRRDQIFCARKLPSNARNTPTTCKDRANSRELKRAKALYRHMYWLVRKGLPKVDQGVALSAINRQMRMWRDEDADNGIPPPPPPEEVSNTMNQALRAEGLAERMEPGRVRLLAGMAPEEAAVKLGVYRRMGLVRPAS